MQQQPSADLDNPDGQDPLTVSVSAVSEAVLSPLSFDAGTHHLVPLRAKVVPGFVDVSVYPELQVTPVPLQVPFSGHCIQVGTALLVPLNVMLSSVF